MKTYVRFVLIAIVGVLSACSSKKIHVEGDAVAALPTVKPPVMRVYLENSGSMDGYMSPGSQLKDALYDYLSEAQSATKAIELFYVNSNTIPFRGTLRQYISTLTPDSFRQAGGDRTSSDLTSILARIVNEICDSTLRDSMVSLFISDCILDLPKSVDATKLLTFNQITIKNLVNNGRTLVPDLSVRVIKMMSDFSGKYYYQDGSIEYLSGVQRPYYIWMFGSNRQLARLEEAVPLSRLKRHGLEGIVSFAPTVSVPYSIGGSQGASNVVRPHRGIYSLKIRTKLSATLLPDSVLLDPTNYKFASASLRIKKIQPIRNDAVQYTHSIEFEMPQNKTVTKDCLSIIRPQLPEWVAASNDESGVDIRNNLNKTTGIRYLIEGIYDSYRKDEVATQCSFTIKR